MAKKITRAQMQRVAAAITEEIGIPIKVDMDWDDRQVLISDFDLMDYWYAENSPVEALRKQFPGLLIEPVNSVVLGVYPA